MKNVKYIQDKFLLKVIQRHCLAYHKTTKIPEQEAPVEATFHLILVLLVYMWYMHMYVFKCMSTCLHMCVGASIRHRVLLLYHFATYFLTGLNKPGAQIQVD